MRQLIEDAIQNFGYAPEHNVYWFENGAEDEQKPYFVTFDDGDGMFAYKEDNIWYTLSDPIAPKKDCAKRINEFARKVFADASIDKIVVEYNTEIRKELSTLLAPEYKVKAINYTLVWPVTDMSKFDPELPGKKWKSIRNARNRFYREHDVIVKDIKDVSKDNLHSVINRWEDGRGQADGSRGDITYSDSFHSMVDSGFPGCDGARAMFVDGAVVGFNAGWVIPNSETYYGAIGLHDYSVQDLGQMLYLEDLVWIKKCGYPKTDMAGGEKELTSFKNHFHPDYWYKTHAFSIARA